MRQPWRTQGFLHLESYRWLSVASFSKELSNHQELSRILKCPIFNIWTIDKSCKEIVSWYPPPFSGGLWEYRPPCTQNACKMRAFVFVKEHDCQPWTKYCPPANYRFRLGQFQAEFDPLVFLTYIYMDFSTLSVFLSLYLYWYSGSYVIIMLILLYSFCVIAL